MSASKLKIIIFSLLTLFLLISCSETKTTNPQKAYRYWTGSDPPAGTEVFNGQYWRSAHWTLEYIVYLKFKPTDIWWSDFLKRNNLVEDKEDWSIPIDAPNWFKPPDSSVRYRFDRNFYNNSRYFRDSLTNICYVYEIQL